MEWRAVGYSGSPKIPAICEVQPIMLSEFNYLKHDRELILYREIDGEPLISEPKMYRDKIATIINAEVKMEITDVAIMIPNITKGKYIPVHKTWTYCISLSLIACLIGRSYTRK